jgi:hypothetical protein
MVCNIRSIWSVMFIYLRVREGMVERGRKMEGRKKSGSLRNKVRKLSLFVACPFFVIFFFLILFAVLEFV